MSRLRFLGLLVLGVLVGAYLSEIVAPDMPMVGVVLVFGGLAAAVVMVMRGYGRES